MRFSKPSRLFLCSFLSLLLSNIPGVSFAQAQMISTVNAVESLNRSQAKEDLEQQLGSEEVRKVLIENGVSPDEVSTRLASLSEQEMRDLSGQISEARAGGDILVTVLLVVLIIFLVKRI